MLEIQFYDPAHPAGYAGARALIKTNRNRLSKTQIEQWLSNQDTYTLNNR